MNGRAGYRILGASLAIFFLCAGLIVWRSLPRREPKPSIVAREEQARPAPAPTPSTKISPIIDRPGDPVLVPRAATASPHAVQIALPIKLAAGAAKVASDAYFVDARLASTDGGLMSHFLEAGQEADAFAAQLTESLDTLAGRVDATQADAGSDDDGGADTPIAAQAQILTDSNSNRLEVATAARPQLRQAIFRTVVAEKIADLLIESGFSEESSRLTEAATKDYYKLQVLPAQSIAVAEGALDPSGAYRVTQFAMYLDREYFGAIGLADDGEYGDAAEPTAPEGLIDDANRNADAATHFTLADGVYSVGLRNGVPEPVIREAIQLLDTVGDLKAGLPADETIRLLYSHEFRGKSKTSGKVIYVGLNGSAAVLNCYAFEGDDGSFHCFNPKSSLAGAPSAATPLPPLRPNGRPTVLADSGAVSVHGILAPIKGAPVTSLFGMRYHPILHIVRLHAGLDFGAPVGSPVRAAADGKIEIAGPVSGYGNHVRILHQGFETSYSHLSEIPAAISPGVEVKQGQIVGYSGNTGLSTGPHLHFEFRVNGVPVDPLPHLGAEIQAKAPSNPQSGETHLVVAAAASPAGASEAELAAFAAAKVEVDAAMEAAAR